MAKKKSDKAFVKLIQRLLNAKGANLVEDGIAGPLTRAAISEFQKGMGLRETGTVTNETLTALQSAPPTMAASGTIGGSPEIASMPGQPLTAPMNPPMPRLRPQVSAPGPGAPNREMLAQAVAQGASPASTAGSGADAPMLFGNTFPDAAARGYEMAQQRLGQVPGNRDLNFPVEGYTRAHDELVRELSGMSAPPPENIGMANSPLAGVEEYDTDQVMEDASGRTTPVPDHTYGNSPLAGIDEYKTGGPDFSMANPGVDPDMAGLAAMLRQQGMTPSGEGDPKRMALLRALMAR